MDLLIWIGTGISLLGLVGIGLSMVLVAKARREAADDAELRARMQKVLPLNLGALLLSVLGLMTVVVAILIL